MSDFSYSTSSSSFDDYINRISNMKTVPPTDESEAPQTYTPPVDLEEKPDTIEFSGKKEYDGPKIGFFRLAFSRLTNEQIAAVNESRRLQKNAKISPDRTIHNNFFNLTQGTRTLPEGYELRKTIFGFTKVVLADSEGLFLKKKPENKETESI